VNGIMLDRVYKANHTESSNYATAPHSHHD
jgi:hypothetical protein